MRDNIKNLVLIFSIILNIAFVGGTSYHSLSSGSIASKPSSNRPFLYQELNLTKEQLARVEPARDQFHKRLSEIGGEIKARQFKLLDLLAAPVLNRKSVEDLEKEIRTLQQTMQDTFINHILDQTSVFTPEQRSRFFALIKERIERSEPRPPWMRPSRWREMPEKEKVEK
jgi:Spy/CpxP family protein refolding chaperone